MLKRFWRLNNMEEFLNIVNENDEIIGQETRKNIHRQGLLHREIHVYFITPNKEIIFQRRVKNKDTFPNLLDATVGGHVDLNESYESAVVREVEEETGLVVDIRDLKFINKVRVHSSDEATGKINNAFQDEFYYLYSGDMAALRVEEGASAGFEVWPLAKLLTAAENDQQRFIPYIFDFAVNKLSKIINDQNL